LHNLDALYILRATTHIESTLILERKFPQVK